MKAPRCLGVWVCACSVYAWHGLSRRRLRGTNTNRCQDVNRSDLCLISLPVHNQYWTGEHRPDLDLPSVIHSVRPRRHSGDRCCCWSKKTQNLSSCCCCCCCFWYWSCSHVCPCCEKIRKGAVAWVTWHLIIVNRWMPDRSRTSKATDLKFGTHDQPPGTDWIEQSLAPHPTRYRSFRRQAPRDSPDKTLKNTKTFFENGAWPGSRDHVYLGGGLNANSSKMAKDTNFKFCPCFSCSSSAH